MPISARPLPMSGAPAGEAPSAGQAVPIPDGRERPAGAGLRDLINRRSFLRSAFGGSIGLAAALAWPMRLTAGSAGAPGPGSGGAAAAKAATRKTQPESTRRMAALLEKITSEADPLRNPFRNGEQAAILGA